MAHSTLIRTFIFVAATLAFLSVAEAQVTSLPDTFTLEGKLYDNSVTPAVEFNGTADLMFEVYRQGDAACILYRQTYSNVTVSDGLFSLALGSGGTVNFNAGANLTAVFANHATLIGDNDGNNTADAAPCTLNPASGAARLVNVYVKAAGGGAFMAGHKLSDPVAITPVPHAMVAETVQGRGLSDLLLPGTGDLTQANLQAVFAAGNAVILSDLAAGTSSLYMKSAPGASVSFNNQRITSVGDPTAAKDAVNKDYADDNLAGYAIDLTNVAGGTGGGKILTWDQTISKWVAMSPSTTDATKLPLDGSSAMAGDLQMGAHNITNIGHMTMATQRTIHLGSFTDPQETILLGSLLPGDKGKFWYNADQNVLKTWDGTQAITQVPLTAGGTIDPTMIPTISNGKISNVGIEKIISAAGRYFAYMPNAIECSEGNGLRWDAALDQWLCQPIYVSASGMLGVGTNAPNELLHVNNASGTDAGIALSNTTGGVAATDGLVIKQSGINTNIVNQEAGSMTLYTNNTAFLMSDNLARVGVGGSPINGARMNIVGTTTANSSIVIPRGTSLARPVAPIAGMLRYNTDNFKFEGYENGVWVDLVQDTSTLLARAGGTMTGALQAADGSVVAPSLTFANAATTGFYLDSSKLKVATAGNNYWEFNGPYFQATTNSAAALRGTTSDAANPAFTFTNDADTGLYSPGSDQVAITIAGNRKFNFGASASVARLSMYDGAGVENVRLDGNGYLGLGTNSPSAPLHVVTGAGIGIAVNTSNVGAAPSIQIKNANSTPGNSSSIYGMNAGNAIVGGMMMINIDHNPAGTQSGEIGFFTYDNGVATQAMRLAQNGNVGIGTTAPYAHIHIESMNNYASMIVRNSNSVVDGGVVKQSALDTVLLNTEAGTLSLGTNNVESVFLDNQQRLGVGTIARNGTKLDVSGAIVSANVTADNDGTVDFSSGNIQYTTLNCQAFNLHHLRSGGSYTFVVQGTTSNTCSFSAFSDAGTSALTIHMPAGHGATTAAKHTMYSLVTVGGHVYVTWAPNL